MNTEAASAVKDSVPMKLKLPRLLQNIGWMSASTFLRMASGLLTFVIVARILGPEQFGTYMLWMAIASLLGLIVNFGFTPLVLREIGASPDLTKSLMSEVLTARALLASALLAVVSVIAAFWLDDLGSFLLLALLLAMIADAMTDLFNVGFRATNRYSLETRIATGTSAMQLLAVSSIVWIWSTLEAAALAFLVSRLATLALTWVVQRRYFNGIALISVRLAWQRIHRSFSYAADFGLQNLFGQIDSLVLHHFLGPIAVGLYQAGIRIFNGVAQIANVLANVFLPSAARAASEPEVFAREALKIQCLFIVSGLVFGLIMTLGAEWIALTLFGSDFAELANILPWLGILFFVRFCAASWGILLTATGQQRYRALMNGIQWLCVLALAPFIVPVWGITGWAICVLAGNLFLLIAYAIRGRSFVGRAFWQPVVAYSSCLLFLPHLKIPN